MGGRDVGASEVVATGGNGDAWAPDSPDGQPDVPVSGTDAGDTGLGGASGSSGSGDAGAADVPAGQPDVPIGGKGGAGGTGGNPGTGGGTDSGAGGSFAAGGVTSAGGIASLGGVTSSGGNPSSGGVPASGGVTTSGGVRLWRRDHLWRRHHLWRGYHIRRGNRFGWQHGIRWRDCFGWSNRLWWRAGSGGSTAPPRGPCDIYAAAIPSTPCVAAHSTVRALFGAYSGPLYQVRKADAAWRHHNQGHLGRGPRRLRRLSRARHVLRGSERASSPSYTTSLGMATTCGTRDRLRSPGQPRAAPRRPSTRRPSTATRFTRSISIRGIAIGTTVLVRAWQPVPNPRGCTW